MLSAEQIDQFRRTGHLTAPAVFSEQDIQVVLDDLSVWSNEFLASLSAEKRRWYLEQSDGNEPSLRKLDNPAFHRPVFAHLAKQPALVTMVGQLIGQPVSIFFSQVFMKPPGVGGPKPIHQDNYYFGPDDPDATLTVWVALDDATTENGCLYYCDARQTDVISHSAPHDEPFNLQIPEAMANKFEMLPSRRCLVVVFRFIMETRRTNPRPTAALVRVALSHFITYVMMRRFRILLSIMIPRFA